MEDHTYAGKPMILRKLTPINAQEILNLTSVPIWIKFPGLTLQFWSANGLSKIASAIGVPLYMDSQTSEETRLNFARLCVEVEAGASYPEFIPIHTPYGIHNQQVLYELRPIACQNCKIFRHTTAACPIGEKKKDDKVRQEWRPIVSKSTNPEIEGEGNAQNEGTQCTPTMEIPAPCNLASSVSKHFQDTPFDILSPNPYVALVLDDPEEPESSQPSQNTEIISPTSPLEPSKPISNSNPIPQKIQNQSSPDPTKHISNPNPIPQKIQKQSSPDPTNDFSQESNQLIHYEFRLLQINQKFLLTSVYGLNYGGARRSLWDDLEQIAGSVTSPWIVLGDFNATRFSEEKLGMASVYPSYMEEFNSCIANCSLVDMRSDGQSLSWNNRNSEDRKLARLDRNLALSKLKEVKRRIEIWNKNVFSRIDVKLPIIRSSLHSVQEKLAYNPSDRNLIQEENKLRDEFFRVAHLEENMTRQKARVDWLNLGDSNSSFFHSAIKSRLHRNHIVSMENTQGTTTNDPHQISEILVEHFHKLLNNGKSGCHPLPHSFSTLTSDEAAMLSAVSSEEIKNAVFSMKGDKAPGPDGFNGRFFHKFWYLVGSKFSTAIKNIFEKKKMLKEINATFVALIPKGIDATSHSEFRPISLCNFVYKTITKILALRLKLVIGKLVSPSQSAFIHGRQIQENILLTHDLLHNFHHPSRKPKMCLKIDLAKAFDNSSAFKLPKGIIVRIEKLMRDFIWSGPDLKKKIHTVSWNDICLLKCEGGLGLRKIEQINTALQIKLLWNILQDSKSLWRQWLNSKYLQKQSIWTIKMPSKPSWGLRSILQARDIAVNYICYAVGKEDKIDLWHFPWHPDGKISTQIPKSTIDPCLADAKMLSDIRRSDGWHPILDNDSLREEKLLLNRGIFIHDNKNIPIGKPSLDGSFSTHSAWDNIRHHSPKIP
ncbi:uncharacterized protein LOC143850484 [Tasmannia lanceolata]|uniref:uncharacterized protein LOC143850484 n=1 Tax=Tasmannia lanceolata TaxID=3420 RepID=UPI0040629C04